MAEFIQYNTIQCPGMRIIKTGVIIELQEMIKTENTKATFVTMVKFYKIQTLIIIVSPAEVCKLEKKNPIF